MTDDAIGHAGRGSKIGAPHCPHARRSQHAERESKWELRAGHRASDAPEMREAEAGIVFQPEPERAIDADMAGPDQRDLNEIERGESEAERRADQRPERHMQGVVGDRAEALSQVELGEDIPEALYRAVAEVLIFILRASGKIT